LAEQKLAASSYAFSLAFAAKTLLASTLYVPAANGVMPALEQAEIIKSVVSNISPFKIASLFTERPADVQQAISLPPSGYICYATKISIAQ
jgi:low temperature requirement protein LtrA